MMLAKMSSLSVVARIPIEKSSTERTGSSDASVTMPVRPALRSVRALPGPEQSRRAWSSWHTEWDYDWRTEALECILGCRCSNLVPPKLPVRLILCPLLGSLALVLRLHHADS